MDDFIMSPTLNRVTYRDYYFMSVCVYVRLSDSHTIVGAVVV